MSENIPSEAVEAIAYIAEARKRFGDLFVGTVLRSFGVCTSELQRTDPEVLRAIRGELESAGRGTRRGIRLPGSDGRHG